MMSAVGSEADVTAWPILGPLVTQTQSGPGELKWRIVTRGAISPLPNRPPKPLRCVVPSRGGSMRRREFLGGLAGGAAAWPFMASAQQSGRVFKIGHLEGGSPSSSPYLLAAFQQELRKLGYVDGQNLFVEHRYADAVEQRLPQLAAELVQSGVDVIFAIGPVQALAAAKATHTIPIVFVGGGDPVGIGLVKSLSRPGGNATGLTLVAVELAAKRIQLLKEVVPSASRVAVLWNPNNPINKLELNEATAASSALGVSLSNFPV
jgi:putative ABC transport system substrate-binding protein